MTALKDPCPCGSGKKYKHCHRSLDSQRNVRFGWWGVVAAFVLAAAAVVYFLGRDRAATPGAASTSGTPTASVTPTGVTGTPATGQASTNQAPLAGGRAPQPYEYDAAGNRHWDPTHQHWHDGAPPPESMRGTGVTATARSQSGQSQVLSSTAPVATPTAVDQSPLADGSAPQPNQYDAAKNRHWSAEHNHWHAGPPDAAGTSTPVRVTPTTSTTKSGGR